MFLRRTEAEGSGRRRDRSRITCGITLGKGMELTFPYRDVSEYACGLADDTP
jgi:hypothetical protein